MIKQWMTGIVAALGLTLAAQAVAAPKAPDETLKSAVAEIQDLLAKNHVKYKADKPSYFKMVDEKIVPHFDVQYIARSVLARNWKTATPEQQTRFQEAFKNMLIRSYADAMLENYDSVKVEWKPVRMADGASDATVNTNLLRNGKPPVGIGFSMRLVSDDWKITDITIENLSLVQNFRGQFASELKKSDLNSLLARMEGGQFSTDTPKSGGAAQK
ncbi:phospholipid-binding protein MlaC [Solimonas sp. SE-A11]|uniref:MlaC/ttg2D family ABC transporter substrate-binding protein n=1 Tax=Solimonas sp. SE-A11 TaxID=3054954 RepID=UPI00259CDF8E|nr:ABC transporter substrate-binding protein [Solimonas sp. SE-A11]MDM4771929.1 ABC transporter substrate-binding protein [Solimonas sp. SE-A11]